MIRYKIYQNQQKKGLNAGKWFARAVSDETFDLAKLAEHMSKHNSPYSGGVIKGVLSDMVDCIKELLPVIDNLQRATEYTAPDKVAEGLAMILGSLPAVFEKMKITSFGAPGETFDPNLHNAVMHVEDEAHGESEIVEVFQQGYSIGDRIIRYAMVKVAN